MNEAVLMEFARHTQLHYFYNKDVLEIGSYNVNGSVRPFVENSGCRSYTGIDMREGPGVDIVVDFLEYYPDKLFDVVICLSVIEHVYQWREFVIKLKSLCKKDGIIILSAPSPGMSYHEYPNDYWRFNLDHAIKMFSGCSFIYLKKHFKPFNGFIAIVRYGGDPQVPCFEVLRAPEPPDNMTRVKWLLGGLKEKACTWRERYKNIPFFSQ